MKEYTKFEYIKFCPISKTDLKILWDIIVDNNPPDRNSTISTIINRLKIEEKSIEALLAYKEIPDPLSQYDIKSSKLDSNYAVVKAIALSDNIQGSSYLHVWGCDEAWVLGKFQQIEEFINSKLDRFNEEQKLAGKVPTNKEMDNKTVIPATLMKLDENSKLTEVDAQIVIRKKNINRVFVVHGHDEEMKHAVARTLEKLGLTPIILHEKPDENKTIIEKFEKYSDVDFAVIILSPDDFAYKSGESSSKGKYRARQNVILELGFFLSKLNRDGVFILYRENDNFEFPSDYFGVLYTPYDKLGNWRNQMASEMKARDPTIDKNKL